MALKINETIVIDDTRSLNNISSIDIPTKAAIEAAGIGGDPNFKFNTTLQNVLIGKGALFCNTTGSGNSAIGTCALGNNTTGTSNIAVGGYALKSNTVGRQNTAIGVTALAANTTGVRNIAIGNYSMLCGPIGSLDNVAIGYSSMKQKILQGGNNVAIGSASLFKGGDLNNIAIGSFSQFNNVSSSNNISIGRYSLCGASVTNASNNIAIGYEAARCGGGTGNLDKNIAIGTRSMRCAYFTDKNIAIGYCTMFRPCSGGCNTVIGYKSLAAGFSIKGNTNIGAYTLSTATSGCGNVAIGFSSLRYQLIGNLNTSIGYNSGRNQCCGNANTSVGALSLAINCFTKGNTSIGAYSMSQFFGNCGGGYSGNTAVGFASLIGDGSVATSGRNNTAIGSQALSKTTAGFANVGIGSCSLSCNDIGYRNTAIGTYALLYSTGTNNVGLGFKSGADALMNITNQSNRVVIGNTYTTCIVQKVPTSVGSDIREKTQIETVSLGLDFVDKITPISFRFKKSRQDDTPVGRKILGFSAQEVLEHQGDAEIVDNSDPNYLKMAQSDMIPVLFNAVKQLRVEVNCLKTLINKS